MIILRKDSELIKVGGRWRVSSLGGGGRGGGIVVARAGAQQLAQDAPTNNTHTGVASPKNGGGKIRILQTANNRLRSTVNCKVLMLFVRLFVCPSQCCH